ncbi:unnamed protein product [Clonostachys rosea]|uniref:Uncharacterized protein n=1 Tax=Bionectria ochroleuca TaxID=29856 RepID=A0ABY6V2M0_BIOOC|nr:unnamed protein product [Clonostachys rosea]
MTDEALYAIIFGTLATILAIATMVQNYLQRARRKLRDNDVETQPLWYGAHDVEVSGQPPTLPMPAIITITAPVQCWTPSNMSTSTAHHPLQTSREASFHADSIPHTITPILAEPSLNGV